MLHGLWELHACKQTYYVNMARTHIPQHTESKWKYIYHGLHLSYHKTSRKTMKTERQSSQLWFILVISMAITIVSVKKEQKTIKQTKVENKGIRKRRSDRWSGGKVNHWCRGQPTEPFLEIIRKRKIDL